MHGVRERSSAAVFAATLVVLVFIEKKKEKVDDESEISMLHFQRKICTPIARHIDTRHLMQSNYSSKKIKIAQFRPRSPHDSLL